MNGLINSKWYTCMREDRNGVLATIPRHTLLTYFPVYRMENGYRKYGVFRSAVDFYLYYSGVPKSKKEFHEVILGEKCQKARLDLDLDYEKYCRNVPLRRLFCPDEEEESLEWMMRLGNRIVNRILHCIDQILTRFGIEFDVEKDIAFYTSHSFEEPYKYSAHIVLPNHCHFNYEEAKEFCHMIIREGGMELSLVETSTIIDTGIYTSQKSFRMVDSLKDGERRKVRSPLIYDGKIYDPPEPKDGAEELDIFRQACITDVGNAIRIPITVPERKIYTSKVNLPDGAEDKILEHLGDDFEMEDIKGGLIALKRTRESYCSLCCRNHEHENPFLTIRENGEVYFHCRRAIRENNKFLLFRLDGVTSNKNDEEESPSDITFVDSSSSSPEKRDKPLPKRVPPRIKKEGVNFDILSNMPASKTTTSPSKKKAKGPKQLYMGTDVFQGITFYQG